MEIEIVTTKKKLSVSIVKQLARISVGEINGAECIGYVLNIQKNTHKTYLIKLANGEYRMLEYSWYTYENNTKIYKKCGHGTIQIDFGNVLDVEKYIVFLTDCNKTSQIYL